jgi:hypothetical protein
MRAAVLLACTVSPAPVGAQRPATPLPPCVDSLPVRAMQRAVVRLALAPDSAADTAVVLALAFLREELAASLRARLGGTDSTLGRGDGQLSWRDVANSRVPLVISPRGFIWRADAETPSRVVRLLSPLLDSLITRPPELVWPEQVRATVVRASLELLVPPFDSLGRAIAGTTRGGPATLGPAIFTLEHPWHTPVMTLPGNFARLSVPAFVHEGVLLTPMTMEWVVGPDGRAVPATIRELMPPTFMAAESELAFAYARLRRSVSTSIERGRYVPAMVGGCRVAMTVRQRFEWVVR